MPPTPVDDDAPYQASEEVQITRAVETAYESAVERLFEHLDELADMFGLDDETLFRYTRPILGSDLHEQYIEWIQEGEQS